MWSQWLRPPYSHKHAMHALALEECIRDAFTRPGLSFQSFFFCKRFPLCMQAKVWRYLSTDFGKWATSSCFLLYQGRHALSFSSFHAYEIFVRDRGIFAHMICFSCWKWTSNRLEAEGNVQIIRAGKHIGMGQAGMAVGVAVGALHGKASYTWTL